MLAGKWRRLFVVRFISDVWGQNKNQKQRKCFTIKNVSTLVWVQMQEHCLLGTCCRQSKGNPVLRLNAAC